MTFSTLTSMAFLPAVMLLAAAGSPLALVYAASFVATLGYHLGSEQRWRSLDRVLAWGVIATNGWLAFWSRSVDWTACGLVLVLLALACYRRAGRRDYHLWHGLWHLASGAACLCFARGYLA